MAAKTLQKPLIISKVKSLTLELTNHCQLECPACPREHAWGEEMGVGHMAFDQAARLLDAALPHLAYLGLTGLGETFLYPRLTEVVDLVRRKSEHVTLFLSTNAYSPHSEVLCDRMADKIDFLQISIDGIGDIFEKWRFPARFDRFLTQVEAMVRIARGRRVQIHFNTVVMKENHHQMADIVRLAKDLGLRAVRFNTVNLVSNNWDLSYYGFFKSAPYLGSLLEAVHAGNSLGVDVQHGDPFQTKSFANCPYPGGHFYITWDGYLVPCCAKPFPKEKNFGNVFEKDLLLCVNDREFQSFRGKANTGETPDFCSRCHIVQ